MSLYKESTKIGSNVYYNGTKLKNIYYNNNKVWSGRQIFSKLPYNFFNGGAVVYNGEVHILGGNNTKNHYKYNGSSWESVSTLPIAPTTAVVYKNQIYIFNGTATYKYENSAWKSCNNTSFISNAKWRSAILYKDLVYIHGTYRKTNNFTYQPEYYFGIYSFNGTAYTLVKEFLIDQSKINDFGCLFIKNNSLFINYNRDRITLLPTYYYDSVDIPQITNNGYITVRGGSTVYYIGGSSYPNKYIIDSSSTDYNLPYNFINGSGITLDNGGSNLDIILLGTSSSNQQKYVAQLSDNGWSLYS